MRKASPLLVILTGPSGAGKDAILSYLKESNFPLHYAITITTRPRREKEVHGRDYYFLSREEFEELRRKGELLEYAEVYGHIYGVPRWEVEKPLREGKDVIVKVDVKGAKTLKRLYPEAVAIFLAPSSLEELKERLRKRGTESPEQLEIRLKKAEEEMRELSFFDYLVVNSEGKMEEAAAQIKAIITAEKSRISRIRREGG